MPFCPSCGKSNDGTLQFCPHCGSKLQAVPAASQPSQQAPPGTQTRRSHTARNIAIVVILLVLVTGVVLFVAYSGFFNQLAYPNVTVSGSVKTVGFGTTPFRIDFTSSSGSAFSATVTDGYYSIVLPNHDSYSVGVDYETIISSTGTCNGGTLSLNVASSNYTFNTSC